MKRYIPEVIIGGGVAALLIVAGQAFRTPSTSPAATATRAAAVTSTVTTATSTSTLAAPPLQPQTAAAQQTTEEAWPARKTQTEIQTTNTTAFVQPQAATAQTPWTRKIGVQPAKAKSTSPPQGDSSLPSSPYANSMFDPTATAVTPLPVPPAPPAPIRAAVRSATASVPITPIADPRCLTIATTYQPQCATANRWLDDIGTRFGAEMQRHYRWLSAERVNDWLLHGSGVPPADYFGAQGYDSPQGMCHDHTPFRNIGVWKGTIGEDGKLRGWVRYHGKFYLGTATDATCTTDCSAEFDHPCELPIEEFPFVMFDENNKPYYSWWVGGDPAKEPQ